MEENKRKFGSAGEEIALDYLKRNKYRIITSNFRVGRLGEIDIIAWDGEYTCFIEVKTRTGRFFGRPSEAVNWRKQRNIRKIATIYMVRNKLNDSKVRFDIVEIIMQKAGTELITEEINLIRNAF